MSQLFRMLVHKSGWIRRMYQIESGNEQTLPVDGSESSGNEDPPIASNEVAPEAPQEPVPSLVLPPVPNRFLLNGKTIEVAELDWLQAALSLQPGPVERPPHPYVPAVSGISLTAARSLTELPSSDHEVRVFRSLNRLPSHRFWHNVVRAMRRNPYSSLPAMHLHYPQLSPEVKHLVQPIGNPPPCPPPEYAWTWFELPEAFREEGLFLGQGSFSSVYHVKVEDLEVTVKVFKPGMATDYAILQEADMGAFMSSLGVGPSIVGLLRPDSHHPQPALVTSYLRGARDLHTLLHGFILTLFDVMDLLRQAARLLAVIHSQGLLHNDIKLANMLAAPNPCHLGRNHLGQLPPRGSTGRISRESRYRLYLIDFGHATYLDGAHFEFGQLTAKQRRAYSHLAPEVLEGAETNIYSEVYSFGVLLETAADLVQMEEVTDNLGPLIASCTYPYPEERPPMEVVERQVSALVPRPTHITADKRPAYLDQGRKSGLGKVIPGSPFVKFVDVSESSSSSQYSSSTSCKSSKDDCEKVHLAPTPPQTIHSCQDLASMLRLSPNFGLQNSRITKMFEIKPSTQKKAVPIKTSAHKATRLVSRFEAYLQRVKKDDPDRFLPTPAFRQRLAQTCLTVPGSDRVQLPERDFGTIVSFEEDEDMEEVFVDAQEEIEEDIEEGYEAEDEEDAEELHF